MCRRRLTGMSASALAITPHLTRIFARTKRIPSGPATDVTALVERIEQRLYPESMPVLASWWLKTVYYAGHNRAWWDELDSSIKRFMARDARAATADPIREIQEWARQAVLAQRKVPAAQPLLSPPFRPDLTPGEAASYLSRVLNEWLPAEVARVLTG